METRVQLGNNAPSRLKRALAGISGAKAALVCFLVMLVSSAAFADSSADISALAGDIATDIASIKTVLIGILSAIIGISLLFCLYRFIRGSINR